MANKKSLAAGDPLEQLRELWLRSPAAEIAEAMETVAVVDLAEVATGNAIEALVRLRKVDSKPDPRVAAQFVRWLAAPPWHATGAKPFYTELFKRLRAIGDPRGIAGLAKAKTAMQRVVKGKTMRGWLVEKIDEAREALRALHPKGVPALPSGDAKLVTTAAKALKHYLVRPKPLSKMASAAAELLAAIRANPADDGARQVYADVLAEKNDPRGMFITMQLARAGRVPTRKEYNQEVSLLSKHLREWLGSLANVAGSLARSDLEVGPEPRMSTRFERGFLTGFDVSGSRKKITAIAAHPDFATVEELCLYTDGDLVLRAQTLPALVDLTLLAKDLHVALERPFAKQLVTLRLIARNRGGAFPDDVARCAALPGLRKLVLMSGAGCSPEDMIPGTARALLLPQIEELETDHRHLGCGTYKRTGKTWTFTPENASGRNAAAFRALIP
jgi:uncharacterized protein (TIGR02996 family)